ncbi:MAG: type II toxin-antitoxin system HicB family antitoxin [Candidatus Nanoarchaeia archaeon]
MEKYYLDIVLNKEKLSNGNEIFVVSCPSLGITSQGEDMDDAMKNIKEAVELYLEEQPEKYAELSEKRESLPSFSIIEVKKNDKTASIVR